MEYERIMPCGKEDENVQSWKSKGFQNEQQDFTWVGATNFAREGQERQDWKGSLEKRS